MFRSVAFPHVKLVDVTSFHERYKFHLVFYGASRFTGYKYERVRLIRTNHYIMYFKKYVASVRSHP